METYSDTWFEVFLGQVPDEKTAREVAFLRRLLPQPRFHRVLDVCCGLGRHSHALSQDGYRVVGVDRDPRILAKAASDGPDAPRYVALDAREVGTLDEEFDAAIIMWSSFGYFSSEENDSLLRSLAGMLRPSGRLILDLYHREFFELHQGLTVRHVSGMMVEERKKVVGSRLVVSLDYENGDGDVFEWELFTPAELAARARGAGLTSGGAWCRFDNTVAAHSGEPRFQIQFEKS